MDEYYINNREYVNYDIGYTRDMPNDDECEEMTLAEAEELNDEQDWYEEDEHGVMRIRIC